MSAYDEELLKAATRLLARPAGQRGPIGSAYVRRSISTSYYALFHFLLEEVTRRVAGTGNGLRVRRRMLARVVMHKGMRMALDKIRGVEINISVQGFFESAGVQLAAAPMFARNLASAFLDAQTKRESADYDLNEPLSATDARLLRGRVRRVIRARRNADVKADRDFKHALSILILLRGQSRVEN